MSERRDIFLLKFLFYIYRFRIVSFLKCWINFNVLRNKWIRIYIEIVSNGSNGLCLIFLGKVEFWYKCYESINEKDFKIVNNYLWFWVFEGSYFYSV